MIESTPERVSLELLDKLDEFSERFGSLFKYARAAEMAVNTMYMIEDKLINADLNIYLGNIADLARPVQRIPFVLTRDGRVEYLGDESLLDPSNYRKYFRRFLEHQTQGLTGRAVVRDLLRETGVNIAQPVLHLYLKGQTVPRVLRFEAIVRFFGHQPEYLPDPATIHI